MRRLVPIVLASVLIAAAIVPGIVGWQYYSMPKEKALRLSKDKKAFRSGGDIGFQYGLLGVFFMGLNFLYLLRKRLRRAGKWMGTLRMWLNFHVFFGLLGPILIVYHSAFTFHNLFAVISFFSLLIVVITGVIGRFAYTTIPRDIRGHERDKDSLQAEIEDTLQQFRERVGHDEQLSNYLQTVNNYDNLEGKSGPGLIITLFFANLRKISFRKNIVKTLQNEHQLELSEAKSLAELAVRRNDLTSWIAILEQLRKAFSVWRTLHRSLTYVMVLTAIVHVLVATLWITKIVQLFS